MSASSLKKSFFRISSNNTPITALTDTTQTTQHIAPNLSIFTSKFNLPANLHPCYSSTSIPLTPLTTTKHNKPTNPTTKHHNHSTPTPLKHDLQEENIPLQTNHLFLPQHLSPCSLTSPQYLPPLRTPPDTSNRKQDTREPVSHPFSTKYLYNQHDITYLTIQRIFLIHTTNQPPS